jgi:hypothetical protein
MLTPEIVNRLRMTKYQLALARRELSSGLDFGAWQASIVLHDAVETCLMALVDATGAIPKRKGPERLHLTDYPDRLEKRSRKSFYDARAVEDVAELRNPAKHRGQYPSFSDVDRLVSRLHDVLNENCRVYLDGVRLDDISLADLIAAQELRDLVKAAEQHINEGNFTSAIIALEHCWLSALDVFRAHFGLEQQRISIQRLRSTPGVIAFLDEFEAWSVGIRERLDLLDLGVDLVRAGTFKDLGVRMHLTEAGKPQYALKGDEEIRHNGESANFALTFVIDNIIRLQQVEYIRRWGDFYELEVVRKTPYFDCKKGDYTHPRGELLQGHRIVNARHALGRTEGNEWVWEDAETKDVFSIPLSAARIVRAITRLELHRHIIQELMAKQAVRLPSEK